MTDAEEEVAVTLERVEATEAHAADVAMQHIGAYAPFLGALETVDDRGISSFERIASTRAVSKAEMNELLSRDIRRFVRSLRTRTAIYPQLGSVRLAVLAHIAMVIGTQELMRRKDLWDAISQSRWDDAQDVLLMTKWPERASTDDERRRVLELSRMMRTGVVPIAWTH